jgi:hypothetical protein
VPALAAALLVWVTLDVLHGGPWTDLDRAAYRLRLTDVRLAKWPDPLFWVKLPLYAMSQLGGQLPVLALLVPFVAGLAGWRRSWQPVLLLAAGLLLLAVAVSALKVGIGRSAPPANVLHSPVGRSYPSGHLPTAVLGWGLAAWLAAEYRLPGWLVRALAVLG